jgi:hypothetical protein
MEQAKARHHLKLVHLRVLDLTTLAQDSASRVENGRCCHRLTFLRQPHGILHLSVIIFVFYEAVVCYQNYHVGL